jgi:chitodextrinase
LTWSAASDNVSVAGYRVWRDGTLVDTVTTINWTDQTVTSRGTYTYWVAAYDAAGNVSPNSNTVTVTIGGTGGRK